MTTLRDATAALEQDINDALGDEITYTPDGGSAATFNAWVDFDPKQISTGASTANVEAIEIEVPYAKVATPSRDDRIAITIRPGVTYAPAGWKTSPIGSAWRITLKKVTA